MLHCSLLYCYSAALLQAVFGTQNLDDLPNTPADLAAYVVPVVTSVLGELGTPVTIKLPGKVPLHERLYLVDYLSKISGQIGEREPEMWLVWLVVRGLPSGLLPGRDAAVDMAGHDRRPIHQHIHKMTLQLADGLVLVVQKDFLSYSVSASASKLQLLNVLQAHDRCNDCR